MNRGLVETLMGAVVLAVAALFVMFAYSTANVGGSDGYRITAQFATVGGLRPGSEVRMSGIQVGSVVEQKLNAETYLAEVVMRIEDGVKLPRDTSAAIASDGLLGGNHVQLVAGGEEGMMQPGDRIDYTQDAVDLIQLLGKFIFSAGEAATK